LLLLFSYYYFNIEQKQTYYSFNFVYHSLNQATNENTLLNINSYTLEEAEKMLNALKTYEEMRRFVETSNK